MTPENARANLELSKSEVSDDLVAREMSREKKHVFRKSKGGKIDFNFNIENRKELKLLQCALGHIDKSDIGNALGKRLIAARLAFESPKLNHDVCLSCKWRFLVRKNNIHKSEEFTRDKDIIDFEENWSVGKVECCLIGDNTGNWYCGIDIFDPPPRNCMFLMEHCVSQEKEE
jgi:hypothetical protein